MLDSMFLKWQNTTKSLSSSFEEEIAEMLKHKKGIFDYSLIYFPYSSNFHSSFCFPMVPWYDINLLRGHMNTPRAFSWFLCL